MKNIIKLAKSTVGVLLISAIITVLGLSAFSVLASTSDEQELQFLEDNKIENRVAMEDHKGQLLMRKQVECKNDAAQANIKLKKKWAVDELPTQADINLWNAQAITNCDNLRLEYKVVFP